MSVDFNGRSETYPHIAGVCLLSVSRHNDGGKLQLIISKCVSEGKVKNDK